jgi:hypothetical protein
MTAEGSSKLKRERLTKANKQLYLEFIASEDVKRSLTNLPKSSHLHYLRNLFLEKTGIRISEPTQHRIRKAQVNAN